MIINRILSQIIEMEKNKKIQLINNNSNTP